jgi:hypothetical protein
LIRAYPRSFPHNPIPTFDLDLEPSRASSR